MTSRWVNYRELKEAVSLEQVLDHYGLLANMTRRGDNLEGACPIHGGHSPRQFRVTTTSRAPAPSTEATAPDNSGSASGRTPTTVFLAMPAATSSTSLPQWRTSKSALPPSSWSTGSSSKERPLPNGLPRRNSLALAE
jgi:hypothetical protein